MKQILVSGSSAYDNIYFIDNTPYDSSQEHTSLVSHKYLKHHGGTGANIAYNLALLWEHAVLLSSIWIDYNFSHFIDEKINLKYIHKDRELQSAHVNIMIDAQGKRTSCYHAGAMDKASDSKIEYIEEDIWVAIVSAGDTFTMLEHARDIKKKNIPLIVDPAQQINFMNEKELREFLELWDILICNQDEYHNIQNISALSDAELKTMFECLIITQWGNGSSIYHEDEVAQIPAVLVWEIDDTTGAGDAYRAWLLYWLIEWWDMEKSCRLWSLLASYCLLTPGSQQHHVSYGTIMEDMKQHFDEEVDLYERRKH